MAGTVTKLSMIFVFFTLASTTYAQSTSPEFGATGMSIGGYTEVKKNGTAKSETFCSSPDMKVVSATCEVRGSRYEVLGDNVWHWPYSQGSVQSSRRIYNARKNLAGYECSYDGVHAHDEMFTTLLCN